MYTVLQLRSGWMDEQFFFVQCKSTYTFSVCVLHTLCYGNRVQYVQHCEPEKHFLFTNTIFNGAYWFLFETNKFAFLYCHDVVYWMPVTWVYIIGYMFEITFESETFILSEIKRTLEHKMSEFIYVQSSVFKRWWITWFDGWIG